jgi:hypothetical protein
VDFRAGLDVVEKRRIECLRRESNPDSPDLSSEQFRILRQHEEEVCDVYTSPSVVVIVALWRLKQRRYMIGMEMNGECKQNFHV